MKIYSMTATFGKLEHETLTLEPGLNVVQAPNEWGKSTWCAFLVAMLYGLDTRAKTTKTALADKERYAPWSGSPMAGRIDLSWEGRDITIERKTKGRVPMGDFRAYETASGLEVPELTAQNCGQQLLGVEKSVFLRAGFIRLSDLPVTDDEALRRRLNALVTTGDESSAGDRLAKELKELKNRIRYNRSGLLPQAEAERDALEARRTELEDLHLQSQKVRERLEQLEQWRELLENHKTALAYAAAREDARQVEQARAARREAGEQLAAAKERCETLPTREKAEQVLVRIHRLQEEQQSAQMELQLLPVPQEGEHPATVFDGLCGEDAVAMAKSDGARHRRLTRGGLALPLAGVALAVLGCVLAVWYRIPGLACAGLGLALLAAGLIARSKRRAEAKLLAEHYGGQDPELWLASAETYAAWHQARKEQAEQYRQSRRELEQRLKNLNARIREATQGRELEQCRADWEQVTAAWDAYGAALREWQRTDSHYQALKNMAKTAPEPEHRDKMHYTEAETARLLSDSFAERHRLENLLGQYQGRMETLGAGEELEWKIAQADSRIAKLEETYLALTVAQETLAEASAELQRRFAPRIGVRAQELLGKMTGGRYDRLRLGEDLSLRAGAEQEDTLREVLWRSDGTVDQLYLALRLAVSGELTPQAPLILDDALVRFDDGRLKAALEILRAEAESRQVLLFTCQSREKELL